MKRLMAALLLLVFSGLFAAACGETPLYPDGIYRGCYYEGGIEQIAVEFELRDGVFASIEYRGVKYKDGDYMIEDASDAQKATLRQYRQLADYLIGKGVEAIDALYMPYDIVDDMDAVTSATMQSSKLISALWDGINRRPYALTPTTNLPQTPSYRNGVYRGSYMEGGGEQVAIEFTVKDNRFAGLSYRALRFGGIDYLAADAAGETAQIAGQFQQLIDYLAGKPVSAVNDLYQPEMIVADTDISSGATISAPKVISAIWDGLNRRAYRMID